VLRSAAAEPVDLTQCRISSRVGAAAATASTLQAPDTGSAGKCNAGRRGDDDEYDNDERRTTTTVLLFNSLLRQTFLLVTRRYKGHFSLAYFFF